MNLFLKLFKLSEIKFFSMPYYDEVSVKKFWNLIQD